MSVALRSDNIALVSHYDYDPEMSHDELWQLFRRTAVEPAQTSSPNFISFADECLLCAHIVTNSDGSPGTGEENNDLLFPDAHSPEWHTAASPLHLANQQIGFVYLHTGPASLPAGEVNIGIIVRQDVRRRGYAREAVHLVLRWAFEDLKFHRVQAAILDTSFKDRALRLFIGSGFVHEGTKRRAVYQPEGEGIAGAWKDVTYLAMLDTEWMLRTTWKRYNPLSDQPVITAWDEMFARHSREREELLRWEESHGRIRKSSSTETLRENTRNAGQDIAYLTDDASEPSISGSLPPSPRPNVVVTLADDTHTGDDEALSAGESSQRWEQVIQTSLAVRRHREGMGSLLMGPSPRSRMLALPSIPSTRGSDGNPQSPLTISIPSTPRSTPPPSPSPSASSSFDGSWPESEEDDWLFRETLPPANDPIQSTMPRHPYPHMGQAGLRSRSRSSSTSSSGTDSWSDAQSSIGTSSSSWDMID